MVLGLALFRLRFILSVLVFLLGMLFSYRSFFRREKRTPFECGFEPKRSARLPFSTRFFLLAVIFLVFDIEVVLVLPFPLIINNIRIEILIGGIIFLIILILGLLHEWREGSL